ncbi:hypothetical protein J4E08_13270 [Sagittula sp. NFXS13]|uniref:hypothetical protein n=1 Tax=Sagittula sp. NFXS13 TaxID=2819095 RepID=UPI0032E02F00
MSGYIEDADRDQVTLVPDRMEDWIVEDHPVRVIDVFVDAGTGTAGHDNHMVTHVTLSNFKIGGMHRLPRRRLGPPLAQGSLSAGRSH